MPEAPVLDVRGMFRRFLPYARPYRRWLALTMIFVLLGPLLDSAAIWLFKILVDDILTPRDFQAFFPLAAAYTGITVAVGAVSFADRYLSVWVGEQFLTDLRTDLYRHLHTLSLDFFERRQLGDVLSRLTGDVTAIESVILSGIMMLEHLGWTGAGISSAATQTMPNARICNAIPIALPGIGSLKTMNPPAMQATFAADPVTAMTGTASPSWSPRAEA